MADTIPRSIRPVVKAPPLRTRREVTFRNIQAMQETAHKAGTHATWHGAAPGQITLGNWLIAIAGLLAFTAMSFFMILMSTSNITPA